MQDAQGVYDVQQPHLDIAYIDHWAKELDVISQWNQISGRE